MKVIDFHVHVGKFDLLRSDIQELLNRRPMEPNVDLAEVFSKPAILEKYLTSNGVNRAVLLAEYGPGTNYTIDSQMIAEFSQNRSMFIPFGSINPNCHDTRNEFWKSIKLGIKGFKFYPADHDFNPFIDDMQFIYKMCEFLGLPIIFHTGLTAQKDTEQQFINPLEFQSLAEKYPDLVLILAHGGKPYWYEEAMVMALNYSNVYIDTALLAPLSLEQIFPELEKLSRKIIFGSDWPVVGSYSALLEQYRQAHISNSIISAIFHGNAERILNFAFKKQQSSIPEALKAVSV